VGTGIQRATIKNESRGGVNSRNWVLNLCLKERGANITGGTPKEDGGGCTRPNPTADKD